MNRYLMIGLLAFAAGSLTGCTIVRRGTDAALQYGEEKLEAIKGEKYDDLSRYLAANGGSISDVDLDLNGIVEPKEIIKSAVSNPASRWLWGEEFWYQALSLLGFTAGWRGVRKLRKKKVEA